MKHLSVMIKPASSLCNLRCRYCFYTDIADLRSTQSFGVMRREDMHTMLAGIERSLDDRDQITFAFQGGEPVLAGREWFADFVKTVAGWHKQIVVSYALQTNATLLDDAWCRFLAENRFLVGVSLDLLPACHDEARVYPDGSGSYKAVTDALTLLQKHHVEYNVLCTLTRQVARHPQQVWNTLQTLEIDYVQFTPCLDALAQPGKNPYALTPDRFARFYTQLFRLWLADFQRGRYRSVKLFDDIVNLLAYGAPTACGINGRCQPQLIVEANGSVYPCDFYCLDEYRIGNILQDDLAVLFQRSAESPSKQRPALPALCGTCPYRSLCGGGCKRMQRETACLDGDSACGLRSFFAAALPDLYQIARRQRE